MVILAKPTGVVDPPNTNIPECFFLCAVLVPLAVGYSLHQEGSKFDPGTGIHIMLNYS